MSGSRLYNCEIAEMAVPPCRTSGRVTPIAMSGNPPSVSERNSQRRPGNEQRPIGSRRVRLFRPR
jgi:hypothetical protein